MVKLTVYPQHSGFLTILNIVQRVRAIGKPPEGMLCLFAHMKNVVVLPSVGKLRDTWISA
jgi:hypothetical protein